jgi:hypothetical protein
MTTHTRSVTKLKAVVPLLVRLVAVAAFTLPAMVSAVPAYADKPTPQSIIVRRDYEMVLDCSTIPKTATGQRIASSLGICGSGTGLNLPNLIQPNASSVTGPCGTLSLEIYPIPGRQRVHWRATITSFLGNMVFASYAGSATNLTTGRGGLVTGQAYPNASSWTDGKDLRFLTGLIYGRIDTATSQLWWGPYCYNAGPVDLTIWNSG